MTKVVFTSGERRLKVLMKQSADAIEILERAQACQFFFGGWGGEGCEWKLEVSCEVCQKTSKLCCLCSLCVFILVDL